MTTSNTGGSNNSRTDESFLNSTGVAKSLSISSLMLTVLNSRTTKEADDNDDFLELVESIRLNGLVEPLVVRYRKDIAKYEIVAGTRRFRALKKLGAESANCVIRNDLDDTDVMIFSIIENIHRKHLQPDELIEAVKNVYIKTAPIWLPLHPTKGEKKALDKQDGKIELARAYMSRLNNEKAAPEIYPQIKYRESYLKIEEVKPTSKDGKGNNFRHFYITKEFKKIADRLGYAYSTQVNLLRGYGPFREDKNYVAELSPELRELVEEAYKDAIEAEPELKEQGETLKQKMAHHITLREGKGKSKYNPRARQGQSDTWKKKGLSEKLKRSHRVIEKIIEKEKAERKQQQQQLQRKQEYTKPVVSQKPQLETNPTMAREQVANLCAKLFKVLTNMDLDIFDSDRGEAQAKSIQAKKTMTEIANFFVDSQEIAGLQNIIIPTSMVLAAFRDLVYESVERENHKKGLASE